MHPAPERVAHMVALLLIPAAAALLTACVAVVHTHDPAKPGIIGRLLDASITAAATTKPGECDEAF